MVGRATSGYASSTGTLPPAGEGYAEIMDGRGRFCRFVTTLPTKGICKFPVGTCRGVKKEQGASANNFTMRRALLRAAPGAYSVLEAARRALPARRLVPAGEGGEGGDGTRVAGGGLAARRLASAGLAAAAVGMREYAAQPAPSTPSSSRSPRPACMAAAAGTRGSSTSATERSMERGTSGPSTLGERQASKVSKVVSK